MTAATTTTARRATCAVDGAGTKATTTLSFRFGAGEYQAALCKTCAYRMQADLYRWSRVGTKVDGRGQRSRLGNCDRCMVKTKTKATTWQTLSFERGTYLLALCEHCADRMQDDLIAWVRVSTIVEASDDATLKPRRAGVPGSGRIVKSIAPAAPVIRTGEVIYVEDEEEPPARTPDEWVVRTDELPANFMRWSWANHALERFIERESLAQRDGFPPMTVEEVLWTVEHPDAVRDSTDRRWPTSKVHVRGFLHVVVNPEEQVIVTVIDRRLKDDHARRQRAS